MKPSNAKIQELVKMYQMNARLMNEEPCIKMEKEASAEQKKEIEDTITKKILDEIKKVGIEVVEAELKISIEYGKVRKKTRKLSKMISAARLALFNKTYKKKKTKKTTPTQKHTMTCVYKKDQGLYVNHSELEPSNA